MKYYTISSCLECKKYNPGFIHGFCNKSKRDVSFKEAEKIPEWCELPEFEGL